MARPSYDRFSSHDGVSIAFRVNGRGAPVVLIHGYTVTSTINFATHYRDDGLGGLVESAGPTIESALVDAGCQVALLDLRGHGHSERPHDPDRYSMQAFVDDVRALVDHLGWDGVAVAGYSFGAMISQRLLADPWVSRAALCGIGSWQVEGEDPEFEAGLAITSKCFSEGCWDDHPDFKVYRTWAELSDSDFVALGLVALASQAIPAEELKAVSVPVLVLNGGADGGNIAEYDLARFIPGAQSAVAGSHDHGTAPSDPLFQAELTKFLLDLRR